MAERKEEAWVQLATRIPKSLHRQLKLHCVESEKVGDGLRGGGAAGKTPARKWPAARSAGVKRRQLRAYTTSFTRFT
jgi:hypothetical protein